MRGGEASASLTFTFLQRKEKKHGIYILTERKERKHGIYIFTEKEKR